MSDSSLSPTALPPTIHQDSTDLKLLGSLTTLDSTITVHLIKYRITVLTIAAALAIGNAIPLGKERDSCLLDALSTFNPVRSEEYILKELCTTKSGRAVVSLCCCLIVGYDEDHASTILSALVRKLSNPDQETDQVSKEQWSLLLQLCVKVFDGDNLKRSIEIILDIHLTDPTTPPPTTLPLTITTADKPTAQTLATILLDLAQLMKGKLRAVHITGIDQCGWIAAWTEYALDLRLEVYDQDGKMRDSNFEGGVQEAQVTVRFVKVKGLERGLITVVTEE